LAGKTGKRFKACPILIKKTCFYVGTLEISNFKNIKGYIHEAKSRNITKKLRMLHQKQPKTLKEGLP
jgi:hypothetical protein